MQENPQYWKNYYDGSPREQALKRKFSLSDRIRYYWSNPSIQIALETLLSNLKDKTIPIGLLKQYCPHIPISQTSVASPLPHQIIEASIRSVIEDYLSACWGDDQERITWNG
jgi:D-tagatose-1,6-bisphosphate aldolase subunit GatZ/KbaZ